MILLHFSIFTPVQLDSSLWPPPEQATWSQAPPPRSTVNSGMLGVEVGVKVVLLQARPPATFPVPLDL